MGDATFFRTANGQFSDHLAEDMTRETWTLLARAAPADALTQGSFLVVRQVLRSYVRDHIREVGTNIDGTASYMLDVAPDELEMFGLEAAAAVVYAQAALFERLHSVIRVARAIAKVINTILVRHCALPAPYRGTRRAIRPGTTLRTQLARQFGSPALRPN